MKMNHSRKFYFVFFSVLVFLFACAYFGVNKRIEGISFGIFAIFMGVYMVKRGFPFLFESEGFLRQPKFIKYFIKIFQRFCGFAIVIGGLGILFLAIFANSKDILNIFP